MKNGDGVGSPRTEERGSCRQASEERVGRRQAKSPEEDSLTSAGSEGFRNAQGSGLEPGAVRAQATVVELGEAGMG